MHNASLSSAEQSLVLASVEGDSGIAASASHTERLFGPMDNTVRQDVIAVTDMGVKDNTSAEDDDFAAWVAYRKAKKNLA